MNSELLKKYDVPAPRYTSYPTVPYWESPPTVEQWLTHLTQTLEAPATSISMYIHIPFCESLCTFCACNTTITKDHKREEKYIELIHREWANYVQRIPQLRERDVLEIHLGGGTPTFLSPDNLARLMQPILRETRQGSGFECSIEVDPRRTNRQHLERLRDLGFARLSMGVQDFNPEIQKLVNRDQPAEVTATLLNVARELGFDSVNFDLIYGLPKQSLDRMRKTVSLTLEMKPDRIALYSYAHVPWIKPAQRLFTEQDLPSGEEKRELYELARTMLKDSGYIEIGMDHFALPSDKLCVADQTGTLHRNFMGYTARRTEVLLGLGVSAISETPGCFHQNEKALPVYERRALSGEIPTLRGHLLTEDDRRTREQILSLMTRWQTLIPNAQIEEMKEILQPLFDDELVELHGNTLKLKPHGKPFLRNVCMAFDRRLRAKMPQTKIFSQAL